MNMADIFFDDVIGDIRVQGGDLAFTSDTSFIETMRQKIKCVLRTFLGEYFLDDANNPKVGVPYFQSILSQKVPTTELCDAVFRSALINIEDVTSIESLQFDIDEIERTLKVAFKVKIKNNGQYIEDVVDFNPLRQGKY